MHAHPKNRAVLPECNTDAARMQLLCPPVQQISNLNGLSATEWPRATWGQRDDGFRRRFRPAVRPPSGFETRRTPRNIIGGVPPCNSQRSSHARQSQLEARACARSASAAALKLRPETDRTNEMISRAGRVRKCAQIGKTSTFHW